MHDSPTSLAMIPGLYSAQNGRILTVAQQNAPIRQLCIDFCHISGCNWPILLDIYASIVAVPPFSISRALHGWFRSFKAFTCITNISCNDSISWRAQNSRTLTVALQNAPIRQLCIDFCHISGCNWPILLIGNMIKARERDRSPLFTPIPTFTPGS